MTSVDKTKLSALLTASASGDEEAVRILVQEEDVPTNVKDSNGWTPLMRAAHGGYKGIVNLLLTAKSPASTRVTNKFGKTALHYACASGHSLIARVLLMYGGDPKQKDTNGRTAFDDAMDNGHANLVDDLAQKLPGVALPSKPVASPVLFKADSTTLVVSWEAVRTNPANLTGPSGRLPPGAEEYLTPSAYRLQVSQANTSTSTLIRRWTLVAADINGTTYKIRGLAPSTSYVTRVGACNAYGWGEYSDISDVMTTAPANINTSSATSNDTNDNITKYNDTESSSKTDEPSSTTSTPSIMFWGNKGNNSTTNRDPSPNSLTSPNPSDSKGSLLSPGSDRSRSNTRNVTSTTSTSSSSGLSRNGSMRTSKQVDYDDDSDTTPTPTVKTSKPPIRNNKSSTYNENKQDSENEYSEITSHKSSSSSSAWAGANSAELRDVLRTLQMDLEEEQSRRRVVESELGRYTATPAALAALSVDELTSLETLLEESIKNVRAAKEKKMKEALGDEMSRTLCSVCLTKPKNMLFLPCKHLCACSECAGRIMKPLPDAKGNRKPPCCPICRVPVAEVLDVYA